MHPKRPLAFLAARATLLAHPAGRLAGFADLEAVFLALCMPRGQFCSPDVPCGPTAGDGLGAGLGCGELGWALLGYSEPGKCDAKSTTAVMASSRKDCSFQVRFFVR